MKKVKTEARSEGDSKSLAEKQILYLLSFLCWIWSLLLNKIYLCLLLITWVPQYNTNSMRRLWLWFTVYVPNAWDSSQHTVGVQEKYQTHHYPKEKSRRIKYAHDPWGSTHPQDFLLKQEVISSKKPRIHIQNWPSPRYFSLKKAGNNLNVFLSS